jgi:hypothetical protein
MMNQEDEILIWKYLDGKANAGEVDALLRRAGNDTELKSELDRAEKIDKIMLKDKKHVLSPALRLKILQQISVQEETKLISSQRWMNPGLNLFALFNISLLIIGLIYSYLIPVNIASEKIIGAWAMFFQVLKTPTIQIFLMLSTGVFVLLIFDQWLNKHGHRKLTTPV